MAALATASAATTTAPDGWFYSWGLPVILAVIGSGLLVAIIGAAVGALRESAARRRDRYARAVSNLVAWQELPYRIWRRTSDDAQTLKGLADHGHDLQEELARDRAWVTSENARVATHYEFACGLIRKSVGVASKEAWEHPPITRAADMNIGRDLSTTTDAEREAIDALNVAIRWRFGWRRLVFWRPCRKS